MNKNQLENTVLLQLFVAGLILVALFTKSGAYSFLANIFATDTYIQAALLILAGLIGFSLKSETERYILSRIPKSVVAGIAILAFLLFTGPIVLPEIKPETGLATLKIVAIIIATAIATFLFSLTIKENKNKCSSKNFARTKPPSSAAI